MPAWWRWPRPGAPGKIKAASGSAETTTKRSVRTSQPAFDRSARVGFLIGLGLAAGIVLGQVLYAVAFAAEAELPGAPGQIEKISTIHPVYGPIIGLLITAVVTLFTLYLRERGVRDIALAKQAIEHARQLKEAEEDHARDRAEWHASTTLLQEARIGQLREVLQGLTGATETIRSNQAIIAERNQTSAKQNAGMAELAQALSSLRSALETEAASTRRAIVSMSEEVAAAVKRVGG